MNRNQLPQSAEDWKAAYVQKDNTLHAILELNDKVLFEKEKKIRELEQRVEELQMKWISIEENGLPKDDSKLYCFAEWYKPWKAWTRAEAMKWGDFVNFRRYDLKNSYTHYTELPSWPN